MSRAKVLYWEFLNEYHLPENNTKGFDCDDRAELFAVMIDVAAHELGCRAEGRAKGTFDSLFHGTPHRLVWRFDGRQCWAYDPALDEDIDTTGWEGRRRATVSNIH